jgi:hypothetical protein
MGKRKAQIVIDDSNSNNEPKINNKNAGTVTDATADVLRQSIFEINLRKDTYLHSLTLPLMMVVPRSAKTKLLNKPSKSSSHLILQVVPDGFSFSLGYKKTPSDCDCQSGTCCINVQKGQS